MKNSVLLIFLLGYLINFSQVGIGTTTPDASAELEINSNNKGILIPRVNLNDVATTMLDGINIAATGLLIYNTNAAVTDGDGIGFYYFNGVTWKKLITSATGNVDNDWYEVGTASPPSNISDNIFTQGKVGIGTNPIATRLHISGENIVNQSAVKIENGNAGNGLRIEIDGNKPNFGGVISNLNLRQETTSSNSVNKFGIYSQLSGGGTGAITSIRNWISSTSTYTGNAYGISNDLFCDSCLKVYGIKNTITGASLNEKYGVNNTFGNFWNSPDGILYGTYNDFTYAGASVTNKYGTYTSIPSTVGGTHFGIYSEVTKANSFAGYFLGDVSIGTTDANKYILPDSRGTENQIMQTDATGNVSWQDGTSNFSMISAFLTNGGLAYTTLGNNAWQVIQFDIEEFDTNNEFDVIGSKFVATNAGFYYVEAQFTTKGYTGKEELGIGIFINGAIVAEQSYDHTGDLTDPVLGSRLVTRKISKLVQLNATDYINIQVKDKNTALTIDKWKGKTFFTIHRVR